MVSQNFLFKIDNVNEKNPRFSVGDGDRDMIKFPKRDGDGDEERGSGPRMGIRVPSSNPLISHA